MTPSTKAGLTVMLFWVIAVLIAIAPTALLDVIFVTVLVLGITFSLYIIARSFYEAP